MELLVYGAVATAVLAVVYYMIGRAKADSILGALNREDRTKEIQEIARLTEEIKNAKLNYAKSRADYDASITSSGTAVVQRPGEK